MTSLRTTRGFYGSPRALAGCASRPTEPGSGVASGRSDAGSVAKRTFSTYCSRPVSMLFEQMEPNERFRKRREEARRRRKRRRAVAFGLLLGVTATATVGARFVIDDDGAAVAQAQKPTPTQKPAAQPVAVKQPRALPEEVRGIHVTMALASLDGKLEEYLKLADEGMNTIQLDVKDENGEIGFVPSAVPLAAQVGAARSY